MELTLATPLLGGLSPDVFMRRHWQKKPLLMRGAVPDAGVIVTRAQLFALASREAVESRLVERGVAGWRLRHGPFGRAALPPLKQAAWSMLVQGVDLHLRDRKSVV